MKIYNHKDLERKFWAGETSEQEEQFLKEEKLNLEDPILKAYISAVSDLESGDFEVIEEKKPRVLNLNLVYSLSLAAAIAAIWFLVIPMLQITPNQPPSHASQLTVEEIQLTKKVMAQYKESWQKGMEVANKPFDKINNIEIHSFTNRNK